jgi:hypothetical protein
MAYFDSELFMKVQSWRWWQCFIKNRYQPLAQPGLDKTLKYDDEVNRKANRLEHM